MNLQKIITIIVLIIGVLSLIMWVMILNGSEAMGNALINLGIGLIIAAAAIALIFSLKNIASDGAKLKKTVISLVAILIVLAIGLGLSDADVLNLDGTISEDVAGAKMSGTGLYMFYLLAIGAVGAMLLGGVKKMIK